MSLQATIQRITALIPGPSLAVNEVEVTGSATFASAFDVDTAALAAAVLANLAFGVTAIDRDRVMALFSGTVEVDGAPIPHWADLSGYYDTRDGGHIQFHCNFAHHAAGVVARLACEPNRESVQRAVLQHDPYALEQRLIDDGMIAAKLRTLTEWAEHSHARATADLPLITVERVGDAAPRDASRRLKVLDCSRVLAGPVAGLTFAAHGADVLLVGAEHLPSVDAGVLTTGFGKRNTFTDLDTESGRADFSRLLDDTDIWIDAYRPGAFAAAQLARHQSEHGGTWLARLSLLRTRNWLVSLAEPRGFEPRLAVPSSSAMHTVATPFGDVTSARPIGGSWPHGPLPLGSAPPFWQG